MVIELLRGIAIDPVRVCYFQNTCQYREHRSTVDSLHCVFMECIMRLVRWNSRDAGGDGSRSPVGMSLSTKRTLLLWSQSWSGELVLFHAEAIWWKI